MTVLARVTVQMTTQERGVSKLPEIAELIETVMDVNDYHIEQRGDTATFKGTTGMKLSLFTATLYGSALSKFIRDVRYEVDRAMPLTDIQRENRAMEN